MQSSRRASVGRLAPIEFLVKRLIEPKSQASTIVEILIAYIAIWAV
jgi:hypothetical protein